METKYSKIHSEDDTIDYKTNNLNRMKGYRYVCSIIQKFSSSDCCFKKWDAVQKIDKSIKDEK